MGRNLADKNACLSRGCRGFESRRSRQNFADSLMVGLAFPRAGTSEKRRGTRAGCHRCRIRVRPTRVPRYWKKSRGQSVRRYHRSGAIGRCTGGVREERSQLSDLRSLYVFSRQDTPPVPLDQVATTVLSPVTPKIRRFDQYRTITVQCWPTQGHLPSEVIAAAMPKLQAFQKQLPDGFIFRFAGEQKEQVSGFADLTTVLLICVSAIYLALLAQFRHAFKPLIVFAAIPYGVVGAIFSLAIMGQPFGFMAFLGIISLIGVIVSHIIVLFEFIEERREEGEELELALIDAGILRLRPVMITVAATVIALFPLAAHGGPLWEPLCYAQIGGLTIATFVTLGLVPVLYSFVVLDLKLIRWEQAEHTASVASEEPEEMPAESEVHA